MAGRILVLNGVGSVGKSSIARALQAITAEPFLHVQMDSFFEMLPAHLQDHPGSIQFVAGPDAPHPTVEIRLGPIGEALQRGIYGSVAALSRAGNNLILDDVMIAGPAGLLGALGDIRPGFVGVMAPLDVIEAREESRGDRLLGLARWQFERVHVGQTYDLTVDAGTGSPQACARSIKSHFGL